MRKNIYSIAGVIACLLFFHLGYSQTQIIPTEDATETFTAEDGDSFHDFGGVGGDDAVEGAPGNYSNCGCVTTTTICGTGGGTVSIDFTAFGIFAPFDWLIILDTDNPGNEEFPASIMSDPGNAALQLFNNADGDGDGGSENYGPGAQQGVEDFADLPQTLYTATNPSGCLTFVFRSSTVVDDSGWDADVLVEGGGGGPGGDEDECVLICPGDIFIPLEGGDCEPVVNYAVGASDICDFEDFMETTEVIGLNTNNGSLENSGSGWNSTSTNFGTVMCSAATCGTGAGSVNYGQAPNQGTWLAWFGGAGILGPETGTLSRTVTIPDALQGDATLSFAFENSICGNANDFLRLEIDGNTIWEHFTDPGNCDALGSVQSIVLDVTDYADGGDHTIEFTGVQSTTVTSNFTVDNIQLIVNAAAPGSDIVQTEGLPSGSVFPVGTTVNTFEAVFMGEVLSCSFTVTVLPVANPLTALGCNNLVNLSVDTNCQVLLGADLILEGGPYYCYDDYEVFVDEMPGVNINGVPVNLELGLHTVTVSDPTTGNSCWGQVMIEDKLAPELECFESLVLCTDSTDPVFSEPVEGVAVESVTLDLPVGPGAGTLTTADLIVTTPGVAMITDVNVTVDIDHTFSADLEVFLVGPDGTQVELATDICGASDNWDNVTFDDEAPTTASAGCTGGDPALTGEVQPEGTLSDFDGLLAGGLWTLQVNDDLGGDGGNLNFFSIEISYLVLAPYAPIGTDNCDDELDLVFSDVVSGENCDTIIITRTWIATDDSGNTASCVQTIGILPFDFTTLLCPEDYIGECGGSTDPEITGYPTVNGNDIIEGGVCNIFAGFWDKELEDCGGGVKIIRTWEILDWCTQETVECKQVIKLTDSVGPEIECPEDLTVSSDPWFCSTDIVVPQPVVEDACGTPYSIELDAGSLQPQVSGISPFHVINDVPPGEHILTWIATDNCGNSSSCTFTITVIDDIPPVAACDEHTIVSIIEDNLFERGLTKIPATVLDDGSYDNCGPVTFRARRMDSCIDFDWTTNGAGVDEIPNGFVDSRDRGTVHRELVPFACCDVHTTVMVELEVTDSTGNVNFCMVEVEVQDKLAPFVLCPPDVTVSCEFWFAAAETAGFIPQEEDQLTPVFGRILDAYDYDESDRQPVIINDPGNNQTPQPQNWGLEGWADDNCNVTIDVRVRIFDDCSGDDLPNPHPAGAVRLVERTFRATDDWGNVTTCRQLIWVVDFTPFFITDMFCNNANPNDGVIWPCDRNYTTCPDEIPVDYPTIFDDNCNIIGVEYDDQVFYFVDNACYKILRTWTVIDWCQYDALTGEGYWQYVQVIKVVDTEGPEFVNCPLGPVTLCVEDEGITLPATNQVFLGEGSPTASNCSVHVRIEHEVVEACSEVVKYDVKVYPNNGSQFLQVNALTEAQVDSNNVAIIALDTKTSGILSVRNNGLPYNDRFCSNFPLPGGDKDYHRVLFTVEDGCGNVSTCEYLIRLEDCKKPTPVCINGLSSVVMPSSGEVTIWAKDFDASSFDDCTLNEDLKFSFSGTNDYPSAKFACDCSLTTPDYPGQPCYDLATNGSPSFIVEIWVADEGTDDNCNAQISWSERNKDFCSTFIVIDDNEGVCGGSQPLSGGILTEDDEPVGQVKVTLYTASGDYYTHYITDASGTYHLGLQNPTADWTIVPERLDNPKNGVSTLDLVRIQKHLLGIDKFESPYKMIAADANNSQSVSAIDLVELRKLILGIYTELPNNDSWRFVDGKFNFPDPSNPWPFNEVVEYHDGMGMDDHNFMGVKIGDVNATANANANQLQVRNSAGTLQLVTDDRYVNAGETLDVELTAQGAESLVGYQFTLQTPGLTFEGSEAGLSDVKAENIGIFEDAITMSWHKTDGVDLEVDADLLTLRFTAQQAGLLSKMLSISSVLTEAEAYNGDEKLLDISLEFRNTPLENVDYALHQNEPNPYSEVTTISFDLPEAMQATITVYDVTGKVLKQITGDYVAGRNTEQLKAKDFAASGILYYTLEAGEFTATKKMVISQ